MGLPRRSLRSLLTMMKNMKQEVAEKILKKVKEDYSRIARLFSKTRETLWKEMKEFKKYVKDGDRVLDLGCGNGRLYEIFREMSIDYTGIDNSEEMIKIARERWGEDTRLIGSATKLETDIRF